MCDAIIQKGLPILPEESKLDIRERFNCTVRTSGEQVIYIELPKDPEAQRNFLESIQIYNETNIPNQGYFTWILYKRDNTLKFATTEAITPFEIGTMHKTLAWLTKAESIHGAGEIRRSPEGSVFNLLSGTYMLKWKTEHYENQQCTPAMIESAVFKLVQPYLPGYEFTTSTLITQSQRVNPATLDVYRAAGFLVKTYPNKAACESDPETSNYKIAEARRQEQNRVREAIQSRVTELGKRIRS